MNFPGLLTLALERGGLRGAPTILGKLSGRGSFKERVATVRLPGGQRISFPAYDPYWCRYLYAGKPYEPDVQRIFEQIGNGRVLIDCGANIGYWSARHKDFGFTRSIAIEANPALLPFLRMNHRGEIHENAVYSVSGEQLVFSGDGACGHLGAGRASDVPDRSITVETLALSDLAVSEPAVVKLDVEGAEIPAIEGLGDMDAVLVYEDFPRQGMKVTRYLLANGWKLFSQTMEPITAIEQVSADLGRGIPHNLVASKTSLAL